MKNDQIKKILVPLDGSENSFRALNDAIYLARQCGAIITGLFVIPVYPRAFYDAMDPIRVNITKNAKKTMEKSKLTAAKKGIVFRSKIMYGSPAFDIVNFAKEKKFHLIMIGSRGRSGIREAFLGSVSNAVVHKSKIPVMVVK